LDHAGELKAAQQVTRTKPPTSLLSRRALEIATSSQVVGLGLRMAALIGTVLNVINQGDALFGTAALVPGKLLLTYLVPYCVATYSATSVSLRLTAGKEPRN
jgi:hypothetical protein